MIIALFAYGSIVLHPYSDNYEGGIELSSPFHQTNFTLPASFSRISSENTDKERLTLVLRSDGLETPIYCATVKVNNLSVALKQLKLREGTSNNKFVSYVRKGVPQSSGDYKTLKVDNETWSYRANHVNVKGVKKIINHLKSKGYTAGIITTFDSKGSTQEIKQRIKNKPKVKLNTVNYYNDLPESVKKVHRSTLESLGIPLSE